MCCMQKQIFTGRSGWSAIAKGQRLSADGRSKAVQAFWALHVEAMIWGGMSVCHYATVHRLSEHSLREWRALIEAGDVPSE